MNAVLDAALRYGALGHRVIPVDPVLRYPFGIGGWQDRATADPTTIRAWWTGEYREWGVGIAGGARPDGGFLFIFDVDVKDGKGGDETLRDLESEHGPLPATVTVRTPSGGWHHYLRSPVLITNDQQKRVGPGIDIRGDRGQAVAPPTRLPDGRTYVEDVELGFDTPIADAPEWLIHLLTYEPPIAVTPKTASTSPARRRINLTNPIATLLVDDGWKVVRQHRDGWTSWRRPGKDGQGASATLDYVAPGVLRVFSTSANVPVGRYDAFQYLAHTRFGGDWRATYQHFDPLRIIVQPRTTITEVADDDAWMNELDDIIDRHDRTSDLA